MITPEKKLYNAIRESIIAEDGINFLKLSEKDQDNIILAVVQYQIKEQLKQLRGESD